jgi:Abortive infection alpha
MQADSGERGSERLGVAVYRDAVSPAAKEVGGALEKLVKLGLLPFNFALDNFLEAAENALAGARERLHKNRIPEERIVTPPTEVSIPVVDALRIRGGDQTIRAMYLSLLATAMDSQTQSIAHPAFAEMIRQLTPLEAKVVGLFNPPYESNATFPIVRLIGRKSEPILQQWTFSHYFCDLAARVKQAGELPPGSIDNFVRLGLAIIPYGSVLANPNDYDPILEGSSFLDRKRELTTSAPELTIVEERGILAITELGRQFARVCTGYT